MGFLAPAAFALAALLPILVALYLLKLRRTEQAVSSLYLWRRMVRDLEANAPWQRLRRNLLLLLQLLFLLVLILAVARPFSWVQGAGGPALILILDTSASMAATDASPTRLAAAQAQAHRLAGDLPPETRVTVIEAGLTARVLLSSSVDRRALDRVLDGLQISPGSSDLATAVELAAAIAARQPEASVVVLTDGGAPAAPVPDLGVPARVLSVGAGDDNQALAALSLQPAPGGAGLEAFAQVANYSPQPAARRLVLRADGQVVAAFDLDLPRGGEQSVVARDLPASAAVVEAQLTGDDDLPLDDRAWAVNQGAAPTSVLLVSEGNLFLETALALLPGVEAQLARPADWDAAALEPEPPASAPQLTILDAYVPLTATLPAGSLLFVAPPRSTRYFSVSGSVEQPAPRLADPDDPLVAHVALDEASILDAARIPLPPWARPLILAQTEPEAVPLLFVGEAGGQRLGVLAFDLHRSDLPLQVAFPVLLSNLVTYLVPGGASGVPPQVAPGAAVPLPFPAQADQARVTRPDGSQVRLAPEAGEALFAGTLQLGVYQVAWQGSPSQSDAGTPAARFAVNLFAPRESDLRPAEALGSLAGDPAAQEPAAQRARREWWRPLAFAALALLTLEGVVYRRDAVSRLWAAARRLRARGEGLG